jgi:DNA-binding NarL/FixJ family response regulator
VYISAAVSPLRIVVIDDEPIFLELVRERLRTHPAMVIVGVAQAGTAGVQLVRELRPDAAIVDVYMPDMNGFAVTRAIRDEHPLLQVLVISADGDPAHHAAALRAGAEAFLDKRDLTPDAIMAAVGGVRA